MFLSAFLLLRRATLCAGTLLAAGSVFAGSYSQNFNTATTGYPVTLGDGSTVSAGDGNLTTGVRQVTAGPPVNNALQLMTVNWGGATASWKLPDLDAGKSIQSFDFNFNVAMSAASTSAIPGAGWSVNFGAVPSGDGAGEGGFAMTNGLVIAFDLFNNGGTDYPSIQVFANGVSVGNYLAGDLPGAAVTSGTFTLTNPTGNLTTAPIAYNATAAQVQAAMRLKAGWTTVVVTGNAGGPWTVDHGVTGTYADPTGSSAALLPGGSLVSIVNTQDGTATLDETWTITLKGTFPYDIAPAATYRHVAIHWDFNGLNVTYNGATIFTGLSTAGFVPATGNKFAISARNESSTQNTANMFFDDAVVSTTQLGLIETGGPVISEFMADNSNTLEDEDTDNSDWIEIFNGHATAVNLGGYRLTNVAGNNAMWTFPSISVAPYGYLIVYASGKNRVVATAPLHTNFTLQKEGGYLALIKPDGVTKVTEFNYGPQYQDISYGEKGPGRTLGYLNPPTPGGPNSFATEQAAGGPAEDVVWSRQGGLITGSPATTVTISAPLAAGAVVRYTTDNSVPTSNSAIYNPASPPAAFSVTASVNLRARVYTPNLLGGPSSSRTFLKIDSTLTNYHGSGQVFSSHLPIVVLDSFGVPVDNYTDSGNRPNRYTYSVVINKDPITGRASLSSPTVDFQGRSGTHVRGSSSATFPQHQYSWELWDEANNDKKSPILGMPSESDWVLYAPYDDKVLFRNFLIYSRARLRTGGNGFGLRTQFCEVFFNQVAGAPVSYSSYDGVYVIVEKIKRGSDRIDVPKLNSLTTDPAMITGGYVLKHDRTGPDDSTLNTSGGVQIVSVEPSNWNAAQTSYLTNYFSSFETALNGANFGDPVNGYQKYIDRDTWIDNQWFVEIAKQIDGYRLSQYFWKDRGGKLKNGPVWDYNLSLSNANYNGGDSPTGWYYPVAGDYPWYPRLHQDTSSASPYELRHWDRYWELRRGLFATANILGEIDAEASTLLNGSTIPVTNNMPPLPPTQENAAMRHYRKWPILGTYVWPNSDGYNTRIYFNSNGNATTGEIDWMKNWLTLRLLWIDDQDLAGSVIYRPPNLSSYGGNVNAGSTVTMSAYTGAPPSGYSYATGSVYYTSDGSDPRGTNGLPNSTATQYANPVALNTSGIIKARLYNAPNWSPLSVGTFTVNAVPATAANLVVSELMYDPPAANPTESAAGYSASDFEYIELLNVGTTNVDLSNVALTKGVTFNFGANNPALLTVPPGGCIVVAANTGAFALRYGNNPAVKLAGAYTGSLSNSGEEIALVDATTTPIADFAYGIAEPWPVDAHGGTGYSLVLCNPAPSLTAAYYNNGANWRSSGTVNGTPGLPNSIAFSGAPNGDTDHDGLSDFFEYATGSNLNNSTSRNLPVTSVAAYIVNNVTSNYLTFAYRQNLAADGVHYAVQYSTDLVTWASDASVLTYVGTHNNGNGTATVTYRSAAPVDSTHPKMFLRLMVSP